MATWALPFLMGFAVSNGVLSAVVLGSSLAIRTVGFLIAVPIGGILADRLGSRRILFASGLIAAGGTALVMHHLGATDAYAQAAFAFGMFLSGAGQGACRPAYQAIVPMLVAPKNLQSANAALSLAVRATNLAGPAAATLLAATAGLNVAFLAIALLWLLSAMLPPWPEHPHTVRGTGDARRTVIGRVADDLAEGFREALRHSWFVAGLGALALVIGAGYSVTSVLLPVISNQAYGGPALLTGCTMALLCGALGGALTLARWQPDYRGRWAIGGLCIYGIVPLSLLVPEHFWIPLIAYFIAGWGLELFNVIWFTAIQQEISSDKLARVSSLDFIVSYGLAPVGLSAIGLLSVHFGATPILLAASVICIGAALLALAIPSSSYFRAETAGTPSPGGREK
ncbi:MAG: MFS transporter [Aquamicrobium sp.]|nr:MFS transporter [Aquamicrobium sp.]